MIIHVKVFHFLLVSTAKSSGVNNHYVNIVNEELGNRVVMSAQT